MRVAPLLLLCVGCARPDSSSSDLDALTGPWGELVRYVDTQMGEWDIPGAQLVIVEDGELRYSAALGITDVTQPRPVSPSTRFRLGSISKQFAGATVLSLEADGLLDLDLPITAYTDFRIGEPERTSDLTLHRLLTHSSGLSTRSEQARCSDQDVGIREYLDQHVDELVPWTEPEILYNYANRGFDLAGLVVETVTGEAYAEVVHSRVLEPLGLERMGFDSGLADDPLVAVGHLYGRQSKQLRRTEPLDGLCSAVWPSGGIVGSAEDLAHWQLALLDELQDLPEGVWEGLSERQWATGSTGGYAYGMGIGVVDGHRRLSHGGAVGGFTSRSSVYPDDAFAIAITFNSYAYTTPLPEPGDSATGKVRDLAQELFLGIPRNTEPVRTPGPEEWPAFAGTWQSTYEFGRVDTWVAEDGLRIRFSEPEPYETELLPFSSSTWMYVSADGAYRTLSWRTGTDGQEYLVSRQGVARKLE